MRSMWRPVTSVMMRGARVARAVMKTRYARELEAALARERDDRVRLRAENARLRQENRALLNSILGIAGIPPVSVTGESTAAQRAPDALPQIPRALETPATNSAEDPRNYPLAQSGPEAPASTSPADQDHPLGTLVALGPVPPLTQTNARIETNDADARRTQRQQRTNRGGAGRNAAQLAPLRRRSWQQINRTLEFEAARKKASHDADAINAE